MGSLDGGKIGIHHTNLTLTQQEDLLMTTAANTTRTTTRTRNAQPKVVTKTAKVEGHVIYKRAPMSDETKRKISESRTKAWARKQGVAMPIATNGKFVQHIETIIATINNLPWSFKPSEEELKKVNELKEMLDKFTGHFGKR